MKACFFGDRSTSSLSEHHLPQSIVMNRRHVLHEASFPRFPADPLETLKKRRMRHLVNPRPRGCRSPTTEFSPCRAAWPKHEFEFESVRNSQNIQRKLWIRFAKGRRDIRTGFWGSMDGSWICTAQHRIYSKQPRNEFSCVEIHYSVAEHDDDEGGQW